jgi:hypothetical protein
MAVAPGHAVQPQAQFESSQSTSPSQSSSTPLEQFSAGGAQLPQALQSPRQVSDPADPQLVVQLLVEPWQHVEPSSHVPSQSSSTPLHAFSDGATQVPLHPHAPVQLSEPVDPQLVVQVRLDPAQHANPLSQVPSQSSSAPLQDSPGGLQLPQVQLELQLRVPAVPQPVVQLPTDPRQHANPSSQVPSQSSSLPLQLSAGGAQLPQVQLALHERVPVVPQPVVQLPIAPRQQVNPSSQVPSQSSSIPLQLSAGGEHVPHVQLDVHV